MLSLLLTSVPAGAQSSSDSSIGVWPWLVGNINGSIPAIVQTAQVVGLDTIYIHLWRTTGSVTGTLHMTDQAGNWNGSLGLLDPDVSLNSLITAAHAAGIQVVGVVNCFLDAGPFPGNAAHEALLLSVIDYLVNNFDAQGRPFYALDGIALDRVRFESGTNNPHQAVTAFVQQVKQRLGRVPLHGFLPANPWHIDGPTYDGNFRTYTQAMGLLAGQYGHQWENLAQVFDVFLPMAYVAEGGVYGSNTALMQAYLGTVAAYARQAQTNAGAMGLRVVPAVRSWSDANGTTTPATLSACIQGALAAGADGTMAFRYFTTQSAWWPVIGSFANPGPEFPLAALQVANPGGLTVTLDAGASSSMVQSAASLEARFDLDDDGVPDTPWSTTKVLTFTAQNTMPFRVSVEVRDSSGHVAVRKAEVSPRGATLTSLTAFTSISQGGSHPFILNAGSGAAQQLYIIAASLTGTSPGTPVGSGLVIPLVRDEFSDFFLWVAYDGTYAENFMGALDSIGWANALLTIPPGSLPPSLSLQRIWFAAVGLDPLSGLPSFVTPSTSLLALP